MSTLTPQEAGKLGAEVKLRRRFRTRLNVALLALDECREIAEGAGLTATQRRLLAEAQTDAERLLRMLPAEKPTPTRRRKDGARP